MNCKHLVSIRALTKYNQMEILQNFIGLEQQIEICGSQLSFKIYGFYSRYFWNKNISKLKKIVRCMLLTKPGHHRSSHQVKYGISNM